MEKPITLKREDFVNDLVKLVNESGLPAFVMLDIFREVILQVQNLARQEYEADKKAFEEASE